MKNLSRFLSKPSAKAWTSIVDWFVAHPDAWAADHPAMKEALGALASWPAEVLRPVPYAWIHRLAMPAGFAPVQLGNAICLGDRWSLAKSVGFDVFTPLDATQSARVVAAPFPRVTVLDLSLQTRENPLCPGTLMDWDFDGPSTLVGSDVFPAIEAIDVSGFGVHVEALEKANRRKPLRVLISREADLDDDFLAALEASSILKNLEVLDLSMNSFDEDTVRDFFKNPHLGKLTKLGGFEPEDFGAEFEEEYLALVQESTLSPPLKKAMKNGRGGKPSWLPFEEASFPGLMGGPLPDDEYDEENEDDG